MKYLTVVTFIFLLHVSMATINAALVASGNKFTDIVDAVGMFKLQPSQSWFDNIETEAKEDQYFTSSALQGASGFGDFVQSAISVAKGIAKFVTLFAFGIVAVPYTLHLLGLPWVIATPLSLPIYLLYGLALAQFGSGRGTKTMD